MNNLDKQGAKFNKNKKKYNRLISKRKLKKISKNRLSQRLEEKDAKFFKLEGFVGNDKKKEGFENIAELENEFQETLGLYASKYEEYLNNVSLQVQNKNSRTAKLVKIKDQDVGYFVTEHGVARQFKADDWDKLKGSDSSVRVNRNCPEITELEQSEMDNYIIGPMMNEDEFCISGGKNIRYDDMYAWLDICGNKNVYGGQTEFDKRHNSCPSDYQFVTEKQWNLMNENSVSWDPSKKCEIVDYNKGLWNELASLNDKMIRLVNQMKVASERGSMDTDKMKSNMEYNHTEYKQILKKLNIERNKLKELKGSLDSLDAEFNKHYGKVRSIKMAHFLWALAGLSFVFLILKYTK